MFIVGRYLQYDSWFYKKSNSTEKFGGGVVTWDAMPSVFPHGMKYVARFSVCLAKCFVDLKMSFENV